MFPSWMVDLTETKCSREDKRFLNVQFQENVAPAFSATVYTGKNAVNYEKKHAKGN